MTPLSRDGHDHPSRPRRFGVRRILPVLVATALAVTSLTASSPVQAADRVSGDVELTNHGFEDGTNGWTSIGDCALSTTSRWASEGSRSVQLRGSGTCDQPGVLSDAQAIKEGTGHYTVMAMVQGRAAAGIGVVFLDADGQAVEHREATLTAPDGPRDWKEGRRIELSTEVPTGATQVQIEVRADGQVNLDQVLLTAEVTALGAQVTKPASYLGAEVGVDADGTPVIFSVATGADSVSPKLVVTDALTSDVRASYDIPGATGSWSIRQDPTTTNVYIGTYGSASLYSWHPGDPTVTKIGALPNKANGFVYGIDHARDGRIYGGTWGEPTAGFEGAQMWTYAPDTGLETFGPVLTTDAFYTKAVGFEDETGTVWAGTATKGHLFGCTEAGDCTDFTDLLGPKTLEHIGVYNLIAQDGYVITWGGDSNSRGEDEITIIKVDVVDGEIKAEQVDVIDSTVYYGPSDVHDGKIYYMSSDGEWPMFSYDLATGEKVQLEGGLKMASRKWRIVELNDPEWPGATIVGWSSNGTIYRRNIETGKVDGGRATNQPEMPTGLNSIAVGPDGRIWTAGYLTGGIGAVDPMRASSVETFALGGQAESMINYRGRIYQGTYPNGRIDSFTPEEVAAGTAPRTDCTIGASQNRPYGLIGHGDRVYYGSQADYGTDLGGFGWLDLTTGECTTFSEEVGHYSVNELTASGSKVYGAMNIFVAYDGIPVESQAKVMVFDEQTEQISFIELPVDGIRSIDAVTTGPDGKVWAYANGWIFVIDPETDEIVVSEHLYPDLVPGSRIGGNYADLITSPEGLLFGRVGGRVYEIDPAAALADGSVADATRILYEGGSKDLKLDDWGNLYTIAGDQLIRIDPRGIPA